MIERRCDIVEMPEGRLAALMPLPDVTERHWVEVKGADVLRARGRVHTLDHARRVATRPWDENWKWVGSREIVLPEPNSDFDIGGGD